MKKHFLFYSLFIGHVLMGQTNSNIQFVFNLTKYRSELITGNFENYSNLTALDTLWKQEDEATNEKYPELIGNILNLHSAHGRSPKGIIKTINKRAPEFADPYILTEKNINIILENSHLIDLLMDGILKPDPPFQIEAETHLFDEIKYYGITNNMNIAEIGAGNGVFSLMLGLAYDSLNIFVNELDFSQTNYAKEKTTQCKAISPNNNFYFINGKRKNTGIEELKMDKIIIRNSFHHFSKKMDMLTSIKNSMTPESDLYIYDPILETGKDFGCKKAMFKKDIKNLIEDSGFKIIAEKNNEEWGWVMLHCKIE